MIGSCKVHYFVRSQSGAFRFNSELPRAPLGLSMLWWLFVDEQIPSTPVTFSKNLSCPTKFLLVPLETDSKYVICQRHSTIGGYIWNKNGLSP